MAIDKETTVFSVEFTGSSAQTFGSSSDLRVAGLGQNSARNVDSEYGTERAASLFSLCSPVRIYMCVFIMYHLHEAWMESNFEMFLGRDRGLARWAIGCSNGTAGA